MSLVVPLARGMPWRIRETIARLREHGSRSVITFSHGMQLVNRLRLVSGLFSSVVWLFSFVSHMYMYMYLWSLFRTPRMQEIHLQPRPHATVQSQAGLAAEGRGWLRRNLGLNFWGFGGLPPSAKRGFLRGRQPALGTHSGLGSWVQGGSPGGCGRSLRSENFTILAH